MALEKTITIAGETVTFKTNGSLPLRYRMYCRRDYYSDILNIAKSMKDFEASDTSKLDSEPFYNIIYLMAKIHDDSIGDVFDWVGSFDEFPVFEIFMELQDLIMSNMMTMVDKVKKK